MSHDLDELGKGNMLFETEDWHDDPDRPGKDPSEVDLHRERDEEMLDARDVNKDMKIHLEKINFFYNQMKGEVDIAVKFIDDEDDEGNLKETGPPKLVNAKEHLAEQAKDLQRAFFVLRSDVVVKLQDPKKFRSVLVLHLVCQGTSAACQNFKTEALKIASAIKQEWSDKKKKAEEARRKEEGRTRPKEIEATEENKFGWLYRELIVETDKE